LKTTTRGIARACVPVGGVPERAAREFVARLGDSPSALTCAFFDRREQGDETVAALRAALGDTPHVLCSTAGEVFADRGYTTDSITGFSLPRDMGYTVVMADLGDVRDLTTETAAHIVGGLLDELGVGTDHPDCFALTLLDGICHQEERVAYALQTSLGRIPLVGGSAGDGTRFERTQVSYGPSGGDVTGVLAVVRSERPFRALQTQHFVATDTKLVVTDAIPAERRVLELNGAPAAQEYANILGIPVEELGPSVFARSPLLVRIAGEYHVRSIQRRDDDGALHIYCAIDEGLVLNLGEGRNISENLEQHLATIYGEIGEPQLTIGFDCILRRLESEAFGLDDHLLEVFDRYRVAGFNTYGEQFGSIHVNQTFTGIALA